MPRPRKPDNPFRYFNSSPEVIRLVVLMYVRFPRSLCSVKDLLFERGIDICHETAAVMEQVWAAVCSEVRRKRVSQMRGFRH
jgi:putative transposase